MDNLYNKLKEETTSGDVAYARGEMKQADATAKEFAKDHSQETEEELKNKKKATLKEAIDTDIVDLKKNIIAGIKKIIDEQPLNSAGEMFKYFKCSDLTPKNTLIKVRSASEDLHNLQKILPNDLGTLELVEGALSERFPLSKYAIFRPYLYLYGARLVTAPFGHYGGKIVYIGSIAFSYLGKELLYVEDLKLVEAIQKNIADVKVLSRNVYPKGNMFKPGTILKIKELVEKE